MNIEDSKGLRGYYQSKQQLRSLDQSLFGHNPMKELKEVVKQKEMLR